MRLFILWLPLFWSVSCDDEGAKTADSNITRYFTGNQTDIETSPQGGVVLMGGSTETDAAMRWFLRRANGGDVLILRASGSDGYNDYFYTDLQVTVNSVETIVFHDASGASDKAVVNTIDNAEAIWFAGGNQWNYIRYWKGSKVAQAINRAIERNVVIGGISAGMAILGGTRFSAENGTIRSDEAIVNPFDQRITFDSDDFLNVPFIDDVLTDTHYDDPDRRGRHSAFIGRLRQDGKSIRGIASDESTAVCIDSSGVAHVYGAYPTYDDNAYFIQINPLISDSLPERCTNGQSMIWNRNGQALLVYRIKGTATGAHTFDLNNWQSGSGGIWQHWSLTTSGFQVRDSVTVQFNR